MKKPKVLVILASKHSLPPSKDSSGIAWLLHGVLNKLDGYDVATVSPYYKPVISIEDTNYEAFYIYQRKWLDKLLIWFLKLIPQRFLQRWFFSTVPEKILRCIKIAWKAWRFDADIVISHVYPSLFRLAYLFTGRKAKQIFYYHGSLLQELPENQLRFLSKHCDGLIVINDYVLRSSPISRRYFTFPTCKILNAVQTDIEINKELALEFLNKYNFCEVSFSILYAGSIFPGKGVHILVQAIADLVEFFPDLQLFVVGKIPEKGSPHYVYYTELKKIADICSENIHFTGWVDHDLLVQLYPSFNLSVLVSQKQEGNSLFLMESIVQGTPVIASRLGGIPEVVDEGLTGLLVDDPADVLEVKQKISYLIDNQLIYNTIRQNCKTFGSKKFSYTRAAKELSSFLNQILDKEASD